MTTIDKIRNAILGKYPLIYVLTWEEGRALQILEAFATKIFNNQDSFHVWSSVSGFAGEQKDPHSALNTILSGEKKGIFVLKDFSAFMSDPSIARSLRDAYYSLQTKESYIFVVSPELNIPESLRKEMLLIDMDLPDENEIIKQIKKIQQNYPQSTLDEQVVYQMAFALRGLTLNEAGHIVHRIMRAKKTDGGEILKEVFAEKEMIVKKSGFLEFIPPDYDISTIGGLDNLKDWLTKREKLFSKKALEDGVP
ncbi:MAG: hypothetical protein ACRD4B_03935, partial [Acidobacteriota bacterium]